MDKSNFFVSVIIPVYNGADFLTHTVKHVLNQNYQPLEIIAIDDGSTDNTAEIAAQLKDKIRYFYQKNKGPASARNLGIKQARGNIIAFIDVDDLWSDNKLELQLNCLSNHPEADIVQGMIVKQKIETNKLNTNKCKVLEESQPYHYINLGSAIYRKSAFDSVGLFDESMILSDDVDWFVRAWEQRVKKELIDDTTLFYRLHNNNMTKGKNLVESGLVRVYKKHLDRLRQLTTNSQSLPQGFPSIIEYLGREPEVSLKNNNYTIISNDCWGASVYKKLGHIYQTPLIGTRIIDECYLKLLNNLRHYLESPLTFTNQSQYEQVNQERENNQYFLTGLLNNDVEIHFYNEKTELEALNNWNKRLKKINWNNVFVKFSKDKSISDRDFHKNVEQFERLKYTYKVCFTNRVYSECASTISLFQHFDDSLKLFNVSQNHFDITAWLNKKHGSDTKKYLINQKISLK